MIIKIKNPKKVFNSSVNLAKELVNIGQEKISRKKHAETKGFF